MFLTILQLRFRFRNNYNYNILRFKSILNTKTSPFLFKKSSNSNFKINYHYYSEQKSYNCSTHAFKESLTPHLKEFKVTAEACDQLKNLKQKFPNKILRVSVETGGCHGFQYKFALEQFENFTPDDLLFKYVDRNKIITEETETQLNTNTDNDNNISIICDRISFEILKSARLDYFRELIGSTFQIVDNPAAASGCGCGVSFDLKTT